MTDTPTPSSEGSDSLSQLRPRPLNFSRPRPVSVNSKERLVHDRSGSAVRDIKAFYEPNRDLPAEPRFSIDSQGTDSSRSEHSAASEFAWDGQLGELRSRRRPDEYDQNQRYSKHSSHSHNGSATSGGSGSTALGSDKPLLAELPGSAGSATAPPIPHKSPKIVKRTDVDQQSERMSSSTRGEWEDTASHHTVSVNGDEGYTPDEEIRKLQKKGINPSLYAEMKAARKGKGKWVGPLVGNTYIG